MSELGELSNEQLRSKAKSHAKILCKGAEFPDMPRGIVPVVDSVVINWLYQSLKDVYDRQKLKDNNCYPHIVISSFKPAGWDVLHCEQILSVILDGYIAFEDKSGCYVENTYQLVSKTWLIAKLSELESK